MTRSELAGWLLLASFALWWPVGAVPSLYRVWPAPLDEKLAVIGGRRRTWQALNLFMAAAAVLLVLGFAALTEPFEQAGGGVSGAALARHVAPRRRPLAGQPRLSHHRNDPMPLAPHPPAGFRAVSTWAGGLFLAWTAL
jgi:hypothetical protein